jgi:hypothetical protein
LEADDAIPDGVGIILVMRNKEGGCFTLTKEVECEIPKANPQPIIQIAEGFIKEKNFRAGSEGAGKGDALSFASREFGGITFRQGRKLDGLEKLCDTILAKDASPFVKAVDDVLFDGQVGKEVASL